MHQIVSRLGELTPNPLAGLRGPSKGRGGKGKEGERRGPTSKGRGGEEKEGRVEEEMGGERIEGKEGKGEGEREGRKGMAGPPDQSQTRCYGSDAVFQSGSLLHWPKVTCFSSLGIH